VNDCFARTVQFVIPLPLSRDNSAILGRKSWSGFEVFPGFETFILPDGWDGFLWMKCVSGHSIFKGTRGDL
jgi:hypothetical protein